jgi:uncharacterized protein (TIGR02611 family)
MDLPRGGRRVGRHVGLAAKRLAVTILGGVVALLGVVMLFTPGPGLALLAAGLAILATEYVWARRLSTKVRRRSREVYQRARSRVQSGRPHRGARRREDEPPSMGGPTAI